jgi:hypothetical protein
MRDTFNALQSNMNRMLTEYEKTKDAHIVCKINNHFLVMKSIAMCFKEGNDLSIAMNGLKARYEAIKTAIQLRTNSTNELATINAHITTHKMYIDCYNEQITNNKNMTFTEFKFWLLNGHPDSMIKNITEEIMRTKLTLVTTVTDIKPDKAYYIVSTNHNKFYKVTGKDLIISNGSYVTYYDRDTRITQDIEYVYSINDLESKAQIVNTPTLPLHEFEAKMSQGLIEEIPSTDETQFVEGKTYYLWIVNDIYVYNPLSKDIIIDKVPYTLDIRRDWTVAVNGKLQTHNKYVIKNKDAISEPVYKIYREIEQPSIEEDDEVSQTVTNSSEETVKIISKDEIIEGLLQGKFAKMMPASDEFVGFPHLIYYLEIDNDQYVQCKYERSCYEYDTKITSYLFYTPLEKYLVFKIPNSNFVKYLIESKTHKCGRPFGNESQETHFEYNKTLYEQRE